MFKLLSDLFKFRDEVGEVKIRLRDNPMTSAAQEDPRTQETIKRVRKAFKEQQQDLQIRALKPHSAACKDPLLCKTTKCFKWAPDKIVSGNKIVETADQVQSRMSKKKGIYKS